MKSIIKFIGFVLLASGFSSCLKDEVALDPDNSVNVVEFKNPADFASPYGSKYPLYTFLLDPNPEVDVPITISYSGAHVAPQDITVNIGLDEAAITQYNTEQKKTFVTLDANLYTLSTTSVTIPRGERTANMIVKVKSTSLDFSKSYVLPLKITSASYGDISGNFGTILLNVAPKNIYHGTYEHTYTSTLGNGTNTIEMITVDANTVRFGLLGVYSNVVRLVVDPKTNKVTVQMDSLLPIATDASSSYDPATKTFTLTWTSNGGARTFKETFKRIN